MKWVIGVDVGGTFTDFQAINLATGVSHLGKRPSTPQDPSEAIIKGLQELADQFSIPLDNVVRLSHGTTVATNALIQRRGGKVSLVTNEGFRDLLEIGRQTRPDMYDLKSDSPAPLVERQNRFTVGGRILADGSELAQLVDEDIERVIDAIRDSGTESAAICLLFSFANSAHEQKLRARFEAALPDVKISLSSEVQPEFREFERFSATTINAYLRPVMDAYIDRLDTDLRKLIPNAKISINQSNGGLMSLQRTRAFPIRTALSGPAAGVVGAVETAQASDRRNVITLDVGGTSADLALIRECQVAVTFDRDVAGFPIRLPMVDVSTIGAGGGSIAWFDADGLMKVGPHSAGAVPGPACYNKGGTKPAVSDANLILGRLSPKLIGGNMELDIDLALKAIAPLAEALNFTPQKTAKGIVDIVVANMVRAIRKISVERGHDPRDYALMPFGGAGPLHARPVAKALGISEVIVPGAPGILCAQGLLASDPKETMVISHRVPVDDGSLKTLDAVAGDLLELAHNWCEAEEIPNKFRKFKIALDMRFVGQNFELSVPVWDGQDGDKPRFDDTDSLRQKFFDAHVRVYGFCDTEAEIEVVNHRMSVSGLQDKSALNACPTPGSARVTPQRVDQVWFDGDVAVNTPVYWRPSLPIGFETAGPAIIEQLDATIPVYPGDTVTVDAAGNLLIKPGFPK